MRTVQLQIGPQFLDPLVPSDDLLEGGGILPRAAEDNFVQGAGPVVTDVSFNVPRNSSYDL